MVILILLNACVHPFAAQLTNWNTTESYTITFSGHRVEGYFKGLNADIRFDPAQPGLSQISGGIDANTISTGKKMMNSHAKSKKALDAENYPVIWFKSKKITGQGDSFEAIGDLTIKDVTREIKLPFTFSTTASGATFKGRIRLNPRDYHVKKAGVPGTLEIELEVPVTR